jgi:hypothetical protein
MVAERTKDVRWILRTFMSDNSYLGHTKRGERGNLNYS